MDAAVTHPNSDAGFSLIEMLVVVAVLAVLAVSGTLASGRSGAGGQIDSTRFQALFEQQRDLALQGRSLRGIYLSPTGLRLAAPDSGAQDPSSRTYWVTSDHEIRWQGRVVLIPNLPTPPPGTPDIVFLPDGRNTPVTLQFIDTRRATQRRCIATQAGALRCQSP
ncbi:MAG: prepilin-type N-terminal cleavage/methylation domain-containing protein [Pseudoruegeria sp.]